MFNIGYTIVKVTKNINKYLNTEYIENFAVTMPSSPLIYK